jgi:hypothetical protein
MSQEQTAEQRVDAALESVLSAAGTSLKHYTMPSALDQMRKAMKKVMVDNYIQGSNDNFHAMKRKADR